MNGFPLRRFQNCVVGLLAVGVAALSLEAIAAEPPAPSPIVIDGYLAERAWNHAGVLRDFRFPWSERPAPATVFRAAADATHLHFAFDVVDATPVVAAKFDGESTLDDEDRVELFFTRDPELKQYWCIEIDPHGRVHDYSAQHYRKFDSSWNCPGLRTAGRPTHDGYVVEGSIPLSVLTDLLGTPVKAGSDIRMGVFRAEFSRKPDGSVQQDWISWISPRVDHPDFHVPSALATWRVPAFGGGAESGPEAGFDVRGVVLVPDDLTLRDWPERAASAGLNTIALHHGESPSLVAEFVESEKGRRFLADCRRLGLEVEYELHAMRELLPRARFKDSPGMFRMNDQGVRTADANLCVHSEAALQLVATNAVRLARRLRPTTGRYFFWGDDGQPGCRCPRCREFPDSDQALMLENQLVRALQTIDPGAQLAHLAYAGTLRAPTRVKPEPGIFLEYAPIQRRYDLPYAAQTGAESKDGLENLEANLRVFPVRTAQVLEYWLDVSRFSHWKKPATRLPWEPKVCSADVVTYAKLGIRNVTTFAVWIDADYVKQFGDPAAVPEYGRILSR